MQVSNDAIAQKLKVQSGALLSGIQPGGPAAAAGLLATRRGLGGVVAGDVVVALNGRNVLNGGDLYNALEQYKIGDKVKLMVVRTTDQVILSMSGTKNACANNCAVVPSLDTIVMTAGTVHRAYIHLLQWAAAGRQLLLTCSG